MHLEIFDEISPNFQFKVELFVTFFLLNLREKEAIRRGFFLVPRAQSK